jgi:hypothetical protein
LSKWFQRRSILKHFSHTARTVETKLPRNDHWKVLYKCSVLYVDLKSIREEAF